MNIADLLARAEPVGDCLEWTGRRHRQGYGFVYDPSRKRMNLAHRVVMELSTGKVLARTDVVMHSCHNPPCVRLEHLAIGTQQRNMADASSRRRLPQTALSEDQVRAIRAALAAGAKQGDLAQQYGLHFNAISQIKRGISYRWVA